MTHHLSLWSPPQQWFRPFCILPLISLFSFLSTSVLSFLSSPAACESSDARRGRQVEGEGFGLHTHTHTHTHDTHTHTPLLHPVNQMLYCWHQTVYRPEEALLTEQWDRWVGHDLRCLVLVRYKHTHTHTLRCHSGESHRSRYWRRQTLSFCVSAARWLKLTSLWLCTNLCVCVCVCVCESGVLHQCCTSCSSSLLHQRAHHTTDMLVSDTLLFLKNICLMFHIQLQCWRKHSHPSLTVSISTTL